MKKFIQILLITIFFFIVTLYAQYQKTATLEKDAAIFEDVPDYNSGVSPFISIQKLSYNGFSYSLLFFDLPVLPQNAIITDAELGIYCSDKSATTVKFDIGYLGIPSWSESTVTWNNKPTINLLSGFSFNVGQAKQYTNYEVTGIVKLWYTSEINNGFVLIPTTNETSASFYSKESSYKPKLTITYSVLPSTPELNLPVNTSIDNSVNPMIIWNASDNTDSYRLQLSTNSNFSSYVINQGGLTGTSQQITNLIHGIKYYWHVNATNSSGSSSYSDTWSFTTIVERTLTVTSFNTISGVSISVSPNDNTGKGDGITPFTRTYDNITAVTLSAPLTASGKNFEKWQQDGIDTSNNQNITFFMEADHTITVLYKQPVSIEQITDKIPTIYSLGQNYPNPFNPTTTIPYQIPSMSYVTLKVFDIIGRELDVLVNEEKSAGFYNINFNATNLSSGTYFYTIKAGDFIQTKKFILLR